MIAAALWLPHEWDWSVWGWLSSQHAPVFDAGEISIVDIPWDPTDIPADRARVTSFLDRLDQSSQKPEAVILDIQFGPCLMGKNCPPAWRNATDELAKGIRRAVSRFPVYALEQPTLHFTLQAGDEATGLEPHDPTIYAALTDAAHTRFIPLASGGGLFYRACYTSVPALDANGNVDVKPVWDMVERVKMRPGEFAQALCDTSHIPVRLATDPAAAAQAAIVKLSTHGSFSSSTRFDGKYVIAGAVEYDPGYTALHLPGPELLAWALSNALQRGTPAEAQTTYDTEPQGRKLLFLVPGFSALTLTAFVAIFFLLKGTRLQTLRRTLPWVAAVASVCLGLAAFAAFELWLLNTGHIQPQVTLIAVGIVLAAGLASLRAFQVLFDEQWDIDAPLPDTYDYDVFISYAHEEGAWVSEHVYAPLRDARLPDGRKLNIFFDTDSIRYGTAWQDKIALAIDGSRFIVPVYSATYFSRPYCAFEIKRAHRKWIKSGDDSRCVLPVMRGKTKILATVDDIQAKSIDEVPDLVDQIVAEIVGRLSRLGEPREARTPKEAPAP